MTYFYFIDFLWHWTSNLQFNIIRHGYNKMSELVYRANFYRYLEHCSSQRECYARQDCIRQKYTLRASVKYYV